MLTPTCPLCRTLDTPVPLDRFLRQVEHFLVIRCQCSGPDHVPLVAHPHTKAGCAGFPWQGSTVALEEKD